MIDSLVPRRARERVLTALTDTRVVILNGARQTGKSTLARVVADGRPGSAVRFLDDSTIRAGATEDPASFVRHDGLLVIDEVQRVPDLVLAIKHEVDLDPRPGRYLLTGSARLFQLHALPDLLPGRSETVELWPLSQGEIDGSPDGFVDAAFTDGPDMEARRSTLDRDGYVALALRGGYPEAVKRADLGRRSRFFEAYVSDLVNRDVREASDIERPQDMRRLLNIVAAQMASLVSIEAVSSATGTPATTVRRYLDLLETVFAIRRVPAWSTNLTTRAVSTPKTMVTDTGVAGHLTGLSSRRAAHPDAPIGPLLENFVLGELARQLSWSEEIVSLHHYRDRDGYEVDAILEHASGEVVAIEVKASATVRGDDFRGIRHLQRRVGPRLVAGFVLYTGFDPVPFGERLRALPISTLWTAAPR